MAGRPLQSLRLRQAIVPLLRTDPNVILIGDPPVGDRVYGRRQPAELVWPFVRVSVADEAPLRRGTDIRVTVHSFSKTQFDDECEQLNGAIQAALEDAVVDLSPAYTARLVWNGSQVLADASEADAWHGVNTFTATIG
jgi:hypothetical protein